ncbi:Fatty acyl-CoA reductase 1 [Eufriesea mexicana]|uniref:Fatty acyl-CoA reductase n=1 Tax=Eufriesea mexicana TaxID=516756 RepID=A0A310SAX4_9HYME|nr:Fatty acyl-CoA reductase 1 [Eufriesea mexicana]
MIRQKKGKSVEERLKHFFKNDIFNKLREMNPNFMEKIEVIYGDLEKEDLGLSPEDRRRLVENVNIIIHNASMVHFVAKVSRILRTNVIATQKLLELARECRHLMAFVYVSTAYSHHYNQTIEEKFYPPPADLKLIKDLIRADEENAAGVTEEVVQSMVDKWINIYSFTKATTEDLVRNFARKTSLPCIVYRPSVVVGTYKEPIPWIGNKNGPVVLVMAVIEGYLHTLYWYENVNFDAIPADMTINSLLISIWDFVVYRKSNEPQVYNYGSSDWNPLNVFSGAVNIIDIAHKNPSTKAVCITSILFKLTKNYKLLSYFISSNWVIKADKLKEVQRRMNTADLKEFPCDLSSVNWDFQDSRVPRHEKSKKKGKAFKHAEGMERKIPMPNCSTLRPGCWKTVTGLPCSTTEQRTWHVFLADFQDSRVPRHEKSKKKGKAFKHAEGMERKIPMPNCSTLRPGCWKTVTGLPCSTTEQRTWHVFLACKSLNKLFIWALKPLQSEPFA